MLFIIGEIFFNSKSAGAVIILHVPFTLGIQVVVMPGFDPVRFCANIEKYRTGIILIVPPILVVLARHPGQFLAMVELF